MNQPATALDLLYSNMQATKTLKVTITNQEPHFEFEGPWTGRDVRVIQVSVHREYKRHLRSLRRSISEPTPDPIEESTL